MIGDVALAHASDEDFVDVVRLLDQVALPRDGVREHFGGFVVARNEAGQLVGCAGIERHGKTGLLRSVAVAPDWQGRGLGYRLTAFALDTAPWDDVEEVVLLTTTARDFFVEKFGFEAADRRDYDERLAASPEWNLPRCSSAAFLRRPLFGKGRAER
jgi:N-acetylglutamate synthase-like GNAT family acetyltransferase